MKQNGILSRKTTRTGMTRITLKKTWMKRMKNTKNDPLFSTSGHTFSEKGYLPLPGCFQFPVQ